MPEQPEKWPRGQAWTLMHAHEAGQFARIACARCRVTRYYKPAELRQVIGNVTIDAVRDAVRCQGLREEGMDVGRTVPCPWAGVGRDQIPSPEGDQMGKKSDMAGRTVDAALEKLLSANPGPVSIAAGIRVLRSVGVVASDGDQQSLIASFAAEQDRPIRFDRTTA